MAGISDLSVANYMEIKIGDTAITDVESFSGLGSEVSLIEVKQYNLKMARKLIGSGTVNAVELTCSFNPSTASYKALKAANDSESRNEFTVTYYNNASKSETEVRTFTGIVSGYSESGEYDAQRTVSYTIACDGAITYGAPTKNK